ncbi:MAG: immunoglobulin domain-containing protein, partial [Limisphaerales bacterium]
ATFVARNCTFATNNAIGGTNGVSPFANRNGATGPIYGGNLARVSGTSKIINCILQHGAGPDSYNGGAMDGGYNISSDTSCAFTSTNSLSKKNAQMASTLSSYPGYPPLLEFIAINGTNSLAQDRIPPIPSDNPTNVPATDGRGFLRFTATNVLADVGAFEFVPTPPHILTQPQNAFAIKGENATFNVVATGEAPLSYQWIFLGTNGSLVSFPSGTNTSLTITNVQATNFGTYFVVVTNGLGTLTSSNAVLTVAVRPGISNQTSGVTVNYGDPAVFSVVATGAPLNFQWFKGNAALTDDNNHDGTTTASLTVTSASLNDQGSYHVVVTNALGTATSSPVQLTVHDPGIVTQPSGLTVNYGDPAVLSVFAVTSANAKFYQWYHGPTVISATNKIVGATNVFYTNSPATNDNYTVVVSNALGTATSDAATVTVLNPAIIVPPTNVVVDLGAPAAFNVTAAGSGRLTYQWNFNGAPIVPAATNSSFSIPNTAATNVGSYTVTVSNGTNSLTSPPAMLIIRGSTITGRITFGTNGVSGVTVGNGTTNVVSASDGTFNFTNLLSGSYPITPVQVGSGLTPATISVPVDGINSTNNINFAFNPPLLQITAAIASNSIPVHILSAPLQHSTLQSSTDLTNWTNGPIFITDTNGAFNATATNDTAFPYLFLRLTSP